MTGISLGGVTTQLLAARTVGWTLGLVNSVLVARWLGVEGLGVYAYALGIASLFALVPNLGFSTLVTRAIAQTPGDASSVFRAALRAQALMAAAVFVGVVAFGALLPEGPAPLALVALAAAQLAIGTLSWPYLAVLGGHARYDRLARAELAAGLAGTLALVAVVLAGGGVAALLAAHALAALAAVAIARRIARPFLPVPAAPPQPLGALLRDSAPFGGALLLQSVYTRLDIVLLGLLGSSAAVGLYSAAYKPVNFAVYLGGTVAGALFPLMARTVGAELPAGFHLALRALAATGPALALGLSGLAGPLLRWLYGDAFAPGAAALVVLAWSVAVNWLYAPLGVTLQARGCPRGWLLCLGLAVLVNAGGNTFAIPRWGAVGAAGATLASEVCLLAAAVVLVARTAGSLAWLRPVLAPAAGAAVAGGVLALLVPEIGPAATLAALVLYGGLLVAARAVRAADLSLVAGWIRQAARP
jgi:O-antigen/teichoic acid export membrane protein